MVPHVCAIFTPYLQILYIYRHYNIYMYIIDIISCTNWLFALLGSYKKWSCAVQVVLRKELGRVQGKTDCFSIFWQLWWGRRCFQTPFNHWISALALNLFGLTGLLCQVSPNLTPADSREASRCVFTLSEVFSIFQSLAVWVKRL